MADDLTRDKVLADIAEAVGLSPDELTDDTNLMSSGLDSIRLMGLIEKWRAAGAADVDYPMLAAEPVVGSWVSVLISNPSD